MDHNLFLSLFAYRPREKQTPAENFLTEAFAYVLKTHPNLCKRWVARILDMEMSQLVDMPTVETQSSIDGSESDMKLRPDMTLKCELVDGSKAVIFSEHKWGSTTDLEQLNGYYKGRPADANKFSIVFIAARDADEKEARKASFDLKSFQWRDIYEFLSHERERAGVLHEFLEFLDLKGLGPLKQFTTNLVLPAQNKQYDPQQLKICHAFANGLSLLDWSFLPQRFRDKDNICGRETGRWGRIGIDFDYEEKGDMKTRPWIFAGFLFDTKMDHCFQPSFCSEESIDLLVAIDAGGKIRLDSRVLSEKAQLLRSLNPNPCVLEESELLKCNEWRKLVVREPLANTVGSCSNADEQLQKIYSRLKTWFTCLFEDGRLDEELKRIESRLA